MALGKFLQGWGPHETVQSIKEPELDLRKHSEKAINVEQLLLC